MKNSLVFGILLAAMITCHGCALFVPGTIKRETSLVRIDVETCQLEANDLAMRAKTMRELAENSMSNGDNLAALNDYREAEELSRQAAKKVLRSYGRVLPHVINLDNYMQRRTSEGKE